MNHSARADRKRIWHIRKDGKRGNAVCIPHLMEENRDCILPGLCYNKGELNTQNDRCLRRADRVSEGNRETGVNPVRSRHCKRRAALHNAIAKARRRGAVTTRKSGNLPVIGTGQNARVTRNWPRRSLPPSGALPSLNQTFLLWEGLLLFVSGGFPCPCSVQIILCEDTRRKHV